MAVLATRPRSVSALLKTASPLEDRMTTCPKCGAEEEDFDGFGFLYCEACGYCTHASIDGDVCGLCSKTLQPRRTA